MEESYANLQRLSVQSIAGTLDDTYESIQLPVQPTGKHQSQYPTTTVVKVVLGLLCALFLVTLTIAVVAMVQISELNGKIRKLEQAQQTQQPGMDQTTTTSTSDTSLTSCASVHSSDPSAPSGVYTIQLGRRVQVWCDMFTDGGGWTRFQRRQDGSVEFNRTWSEYRTGFGSADAEFWMGNDDLNTLTATQPSELRVELWDWEGNYSYASYSNFSVDSEANNYTLHLDGYNGNSSDSLTDRHNSQPFTTIDRDNDGYSGSCARSHGGGGWWYAHCHHSNLNGRYFRGGMINQRGVNWYWWQRNWYSYKAVSMMVRPR